MAPLSTVTFNALAGVGCLASAFVATRLYNFIHLYLIRGSTIHRFNRPQSTAWAIVTGASDGVGKATAKELQGRGFNVIIHGRNRTKLEAVAAELNKEFPKLQVELAVGDATDPTSAVSAVVEITTRVRQSGGKVTVVINNLGGGGIFGIETFNSYTDLEPAMIDKMMNLNIIFPMQLVRALLPELEQNQPALILNTSSFASLGSPFLVPYASAKAALNIFTNSLSMEMETLNKDIEVMGIMLGSVITPGNHMEKPHFFAPTPETVARNTIDRVGCGKSTVTASWRHFVLGDLGQWFPDVVVRKGLQRELVRRRDAEQALKKTS